MLTAVLRCGRAERHHPQHQVQGESQVSDVPVQMDAALDLRAVIDALPRAVIVTDPDARILLWNQQAEQLYGWAADEVLGKAVTDVLVPASEQDGAAAILTEVNAGGSWEGDFTVLRRDGTPVRIWVRDQPVVDAEGVVVAIVGASEDVTDLRRIEQQNADLTEHLRLAAEEERVHRERLEVLSLVNDALAAAETREEVMANVVHAVVPGLGRLVLAPRPGRRSGPRRRDRPRRPDQGCLRPLAAGAEPLRPRCCEGDPEGDQDR